MPILDPIQERITLSFLKGNPDDAALDGNILALFPQTGHGSQVTKWIRDQIENGNFNAIFNDTQKRDRLINILQAYFDFFTKGAIDDRIINPVENDNTIPVRTMITLGASNVKLIDTNLKGYFHLTECGLGSILLCNQNLDFEKDDFTSYLLTNYFDKPVDDSTEKGKRYGIAFNTNQNIGLDRIIDTWRIRDQVDRINTQANELTFSDLVITKLGISYNVDLNSLPSLSISNLKTGIHTISQKQKVYKNENGEVKDINPSKDYQIAVSGITLNSLDDITNTGFLSGRWHRVTRNKVLFTGKIFDKDGSRFLLGFTNNDNTADIHIFKGIVFDHHVTNGKTTIEKIADLEGNLSKYSEAGEYEKFTGTITNQTTLKNIDGNFGFSQARRDGIWTGSYKTISLEE